MAGKIHQTGLGPKKPKIEINKTTKQQFWQNPWFTLILFLLFIYLSFFLWPAKQAQQVEPIPYSKFLQYVEKDQVEKAVISNQSIYGTLKINNPKTGQPVHFVTVPLWNQQLADLLVSHHVDYSVKPKGNDWLAQFFFNWILPFGLLFLFWAWFSQRMSGGLGKGFLNIGNHVHVHPEQGPKTTFEDVAGYQDVKQELRETVDFLKDPKRIQELGARSPKGVLLVGPPGTGKTLLARAVAGEAGVPFFKISGSEFIEMFVGVGAARVRELFEEARKQAPCIIFIDEIDAIGAARGAAPATGGHDEREQTLNQLLTEMDGFDPSTGVVVMAATNRPEILDQALLRAGRFDRRILVDKPDLATREAILKLYAGKMKLATDVNLHIIAQRTPGFVGADLENVCNEAAIQALRANRDQVTMADFEAAIDRIIAGPEAKQKVLTADEKHRVAVHESGHTVVALAVPTGEPVHQVTIIPRTIGALGFTLQLPVSEKYLSTTEEIKDQIAILLGGRAAEEVILGSISSGAANDLEKATELARNMVARLGMDEKLGPVVWGREQRLQYLSSAQTVEDRNYSQATAQAIDEEIKALVEEGHERAREILNRCRETLEKLSAELEARENLKGEDVIRIAGKCQHSSKTHAGKQNS